MLRYSRFLGKQWTILNFLFLVYLFIYLYTYIDGDVIVSSSASLPPISSSSSFLFDLNDELVMEDGTSDTGIIFFCCFMFIFSLLYP